MPSRFSRAGAGPLVVFSLVIASTGMVRSDGNRANLGDLKWLTGSWSQTREGTTTEEHWIAPRGGLMLGVNRTTKEKAKTSFEFMRIEERPDGLAYLAQPQGKKETVFPLKNLKPNEVVFENPNHDFPQRIIYRLDDQGKLIGRIEGEIGGKARAKEWVWEKVTKTEP